MTNPYRNLPGPVPADYARFVRRLGCILCGAPAEAAHVRYADDMYDKGHTGLSQKPGDEWIIPLCPEHHRLNNNAQHRGNEYRWWKSVGVDPLLYCCHIRKSYPDENKALWPFPAPMKTQHRSRP